MKILKLLSNFLLISFFSIVLFETSFSNEPVDIWKIERKDKSQNTDSSNIESADDKSILSEKIKNKNETIIVNQELDSKKIKLFGLYEPTDNGLSIDMWSNSDGNEIKEILIKINEKKLSDISEEILDIVLLTNSYQPVKNISSKEFLDFKFNYLIKQKDFELIKKFLIKNPQIEYNDKLVKFYTDFHLANSQLEKSCEIFEIVSLVNDEYLSNFKIYCLINQNKNEEAQLLFDLKTELGDVEEFFLKKFNFLMGYDIKDQSFSDNNILNLHISHKTNENFNYEPTIDTPIFVWKYLSSSNLLKKTELVNLENIEQIKIIEKATNDGIYEEKELLDLYKRFQFDINQLINFKDIYKDLPDYEGRALLYQRLLLTVDIEQKLDLCVKLKKYFIESGLSNAFNKELSIILKKINKDEIPSNFTTFYEQNKEADKIIESKIKFNNKFIHQSKLLNYFLNKTSLPKVEKETNNLLKKIKRDKKYVISKKDTILLESLKSDGVQLLKKYDDLYEYKSNLPPEINLKLENGESALVLLKLVEIIGEDKIEDLDINSVNFIVEILNKLNAIDLRNKILLKVLPLKV
tara:strand:+ start:563 stop:2299 length:1737 start_codon:yes stop_codon:yes gene_type:complete